MVVTNKLNSNGGTMFSLRKKKMGRPPKKAGERATYKQVAVSPEAHTKLKQLADKNNKSIIDTVNELVGV